MMSKEKLVKDLRRCRNPDYCGLRCPRFSFAEDCIGKLTTDAADAIEELLAAVPQWISVEDELPEEWKPVLAYDPIGYGEIGIAFIVGSLNTVVWRGVGFTNTAYPPNVTYWMPLSKPPKEVE